MSPNKYIPPELGKDAFNCPFCRAYSHQEWGEGWFIEAGRPITQAKHTSVENIRLSLCMHCERYSIWAAGLLVYPESSPAPLPNQDLPSEIKRDYDEAGLIVQKSPRGAAALLRLCIQKLCEHLGYRDMDINDAIGEMVKKGLSPKIQKALDVVRVIGNNAVHPGELDIKDDQETAIKLFELINLITYDQITQPKEVDALFAKIPKGAKSAIEKRDKKLKKANN